LVTANVTKRFAVQPIAGSSVLTWVSAVNRETKIQPNLIALARSRRMQRALAHAYLHRDTPLPELHTSLGYMTSTARVTDDTPTTGHRMAVLGVARREGVAYIVEEVGEDDAPVVYRMYLRGPRQGHLVPQHAWYDQAADVADIRARIAALAPRLEPVLAIPREAWMLSTRIIQRRALRVIGPDGLPGMPIRKFALQLVVEPVRGPGASGRSTVTAFLTPHAQLADVWSLAYPGAARDPRDAGCDLAIARVTFAGIPSGTGLAKDTVVLLTTSATNDREDSPAASRC